MTDLIWLGLAAAGLLLALVLLVRFWRVGGQDYSADWARISWLAESADTAGLAVIEADKLLDRVLRRGGWRGETMSDRLRSASKRFGDYNGLRRVHRLRNRLVHETGARVSRRQAAGALKVYRRGLKDLGVGKL